MNSQRLVVVADAHLTENSPQDVEAFLAFLDAVPEMGDTLLLAGDIYDFWFTYTRLIPRHCIKVTAAIVMLARRMPVLMLGGNHDRWGEGFWGPQAGVTFAPRELRFRCGDREVLAVHGDGLHAEGPRARFLNGLLDNPVVIQAFKAVPTALGFRIARHLGHDPATAAAHPESVAIAAERQAAWAEQTLAAQPSVGALIMGHTHREALREVSPNRWYLNPGPWLGEHRYALLDANDASLARFS